MFEIDNTPFPKARIVTSQYSDTFAAMRPGQNLKTEPENVHKVASAMRNWIEKQGRTDVVVRIVSKMRDEKGRVYGHVYMMPAKPVKMADLPSRKIEKLNLKSA